MMAPPISNESTRRNFLAFFASTGLSNTLLPGALWAKWQQQPGERITLQVLEEAAKLSGLDLTADEQRAMLDGLNENLKRYDE